MAEEKDILDITQSLTAEAAPVVPDITTGDPSTQAQEDLFQASEVVEDDYSGAHTDKLDNQEEASLLAELSAPPAEEEAPVKMTQAEVTQAFVEGPESLPQFAERMNAPLKGVAESTFKGLGGLASGAWDIAQEAPTAGIGGVMDWANSTISLVDELYGAVEGLIAGESDELKAAKELTPEQKARAEKSTDKKLIRKDGDINLDEAAPQLPTTAEDEKTTGGKIIRAATSFLTGFFVAGKIPGLQTTGAAGADIAVNAVKSALSAFSGPVYEQRLSTLLNDIPALEGIVPDFMAGDPDDSQLEKRFKNSLEELGFGAVVDKLMLGFKAGRAARITKEKMASAGLIEPPPRVAEGLDALGRAEDDLVRNSTFDPPPVAETPLGVEHPLEPNVRRFSDVEKELRAPPPGKREALVATKEQVVDVISQTKKDYPGEKRLLFRVMYEEDLAFKEGFIQANPVGHRSEKVDNISASWWSTSYKDAVGDTFDIKDFRADGRKTIVVAMDADNLTPQAYLQNATPLGNLDNVWIGLPADVPIGSVKRVDIPDNVAKIATTKGGKNVRGVGKDDVGPVGKGPGRQGIPGDVSGGTELGIGEALPAGAKAPDVGGDGGTLAFSSISDAGPGEIKINFARMDQSDDISQVIQNLADANAKSITEAKRGVRTWKETELSAAEQDAWKLINDRAPAGTFNAEQTRAVRELWAQSGAKLKEVVDTASAAPTAENMYMFRRMMETHRMIQNRVISARAEGARALNSWRMQAGSGADQLRNIEAMMDQTGGKEVSEKMLMKYKNLLDSGNVVGAEKFIEKSLWAKTSDAVAQVWINALLSSPHTHARNFISQTAVITQLIAERGAAELGFGGGTNGVVSGEAAQMVFGLVEGLKDAFRVSSKGRQAALAAGKRAAKGDLAGAKQTLKESSDEFGTVFQTAATGETGIGMGKIELPREGALNAEALGVDSPGIGMVFNMLDTLSSMSGKALATSDEAFKTGAYRMELNSQALRQATGEIEEGIIKKSELGDRISQLVNDPPEKLHVASQDMAAYATFTGKPAEKAFNAIKGFAGLPVIGKIVIPFKKTPVNIATYGFERTPLAPLVKTWRDDIAAGGARKQLALSKFYTGNALLLLAADLAMSGHITGDGPLNQGQRENMTVQGWKPNSIRVPTSDGKNRYFSYRGTEPISTTLGLAANMVEILENTDSDDPNFRVDEAVNASIMAIASQVTSQNYMQGMSDFFEAMSDPRRYGENWTKKLTGSLVPAGAAQLARVEDPYLRAATDFLDPIKRRTYGMSEDLPFVRDAWGSKIDVRSGLGPAYDTLIPIYSSKEKDIPIAKEMDSLEYWVRRPSKRVMFGQTSPMDISNKSITIDMDRYPFAYDRYLELAGNAQTETVLGIPIDPMTGLGLKDNLNALVTGDHPLSQIYDLTEDQGGGRDSKVRMIQGYIRQYREAARMQLLEEFPDLRADVEMQKKNQSGFVPLD